MKEKVHESPYVVVYYDADNHLLSKKWLPATEQMPGKEFKKEMKIYGQLVRQYKPDKELVDTKDFLFAISPTLQDWVSKDIFAIYREVGLIKAAFISSSDFISQLSLEQAMDENYGQELIKRYFDNEDDARQWLLK